MSLSPPTSIIGTFAGIATAHAKTWQSNSHHIAWDGFLYDDQGRSEEQAIREVAGDLARGQAVADVASRLRGTFLIVVHDRQAQRTDCWIDPNGLFAAYRSAGAVSRSFLDLFRHEQLGRDDLRPDKLIEFLHLGNVYFNETYVEGIRQITPDELITVGPTGCEVATRRIPQITDNPRFPTMLDAFEPLANAARQRRVSIDLTGGFDSRLMAVLLQAHGVPFEASLSGFREHPDCATGKAVADAMNVPYHFTEWNPRDLDEDLPDLLTRADGMEGLLSVCHRLYQLNADRLDRGIELVMKGLGGALYKDFFWLQDFPLYWRRKANMALLHRMRIEFEQLTTRQLTDEYFEIYRQARQQRVMRLQAYELDANTRSYDNVYLEARVRTWNSHTLTCLQQPEIASHAPPCEMEMLQLPFAAPRLHRFFNRYQKAIMTELNRDVARLRTTDGTTASNEIRHSVRNAFVFSANRARSLRKKLIQLVNNRTEFKIPLMVDSRRIAAHPLGHAALEQLKQAGILRPNVTYDDISPRFQEHAVMLGWFLEWVNRSSMLPTVASHSPDQQSP